MFDFRSCHDRKSCLSHAFWWAKKTQKEKSFVCQIKDNFIFIFFAYHHERAKKKKKCMSHEIATYKILTRKNFKSQVLGWNLNPSWQIEVLTQLKISIWLIKAFIFNASKLFNSKHYPYDNDDMSLDKLIMKFTILKVKNVLCKVDLLEFIETLGCKCDNKWWNPCTPYINKSTPTPKKKEKQGTKWKDPNPRRQMNHPRRWWTTRGTSSSWTRSNWEKHIK